jgi:superfamily II DNA or RNA helicase
MSLLHRAVAELAVRCDGALDKDEQGFNKPDSYLGKYMAAVPFASWTPEMARAAWEMLAKYKVQLLRYGVDYDAIEEPPAAEGAIGKNLIDFNSERREFDVTFDYSWQMKERVKAMPGAQYRGNGAWHLPVTSHEALVAFAGDYHFLMTAGALDALARIDELVAAARAEAPAKNAGPAHAIDFDGAAFQIRFPKADAPLRQVVKETVPGRRWDGEARCWTAPHSAGRALAALAEQFDFAVADDARAAFVTAPAPHRVELGEDCFRVYFPYDEALKEAIKTVPGYRPEKRPEFHWQIPIPSAAQLAAFLHGREQFAVPGAVKEAIEGVLSLQTKNVIQSRAPDANIEITGLGGELLPFQRAGAAYAIRNRRVLIGDEMGLGKTVQSLAVLQALDAFPALVVCPASLKLNWKREAEKWLPGRRVEVLSNGDACDYLADVFIINYDILAAGWKNKKMRGVKLSGHTLALQVLGLKALVLDESHYVKSRDAQRTRACLALASGKELETVLLLSGTPLENRPAELISQLEIAGRLEEFGGLWRFATRYCNVRQTRYGLDLTGAAHLDELNEKLRATCMIRRRKQDVLTELPPKRRATVVVELANRAVYEQAEADTIAWLRLQAVEDGEFRATLAGLSEQERKAAVLLRQSEAAMKARRAEQLVRISALKQLAAEGKLKAVVEWVETFLESGEKLVLFGYHKSVVKALAEHFGAPVIMGDTSVEDRQAAVDRFQNDPDCRLILGNLQAMGVGLTLTAASNVAFVELGWTPAIHEQANDRCHRIGTRADSVTAWYLLAENTIDEQIAALIEAKRAVVDAATDGAAGRAQVDVLDDLIASLVG